MKGGFVVDEFEKLFMCYQKDVMNFLLALTKQPSLAEDLTQDTFLHAYLGFDRFRKECSPKSWLLQIAKNEFFSYLRRNKMNPEFVTHDPFLLEITDINQTSTEDKLYQQELIQSIMDYIFSLDERSKTILIDRIWLGKSYKLISAELNISEVSAKMIFSRSRKAIKTKFKGEFNCEE